METVNRKMTADGTWYGERQRLYNA